MCSYQQEQQQKQGDTRNILVVMDMFIIFFVVTVYAYV